MGLIVTSESQALRHGAYIILKTPPAIVQPTGNGISALVEQFPWGPDQVLYTPSSTGDRLKTFAPYGMSRLGPGYLSMIAKGFPLLKIVRVTGTSPAIATATVNKSGPTAMLTLTLKYNGAAGNSVTWTTSAATDGNSNHFNLTVQVTGASGTTTDTIQNLNYSGTGSDSAPDFSSLQLLGGITKLASGIPLNGSGSFAGGSDGTISAASYVGTQGAGDAGFAKLEGDKTIRAFFTGDPGNSFRSAVNSGAVSHANYVGDRMAYINGNSGQSLSAAQSDVPNYRSINAVYVDPWVNIFDDTTGAKQLVTPASFVASVAGQLPPSTSFAWKGVEVGQMLQGIVALEADRGDGAASNTTAGIATLIAEDAGGFRIEAGVNTAFAQDISIGDDTRSRVIHYIGRAIVNAARPFVDGPNVPETQQNVIDPVDRFLLTSKNAQKNDPVHTFHILDYAIGDLSSDNTDNSIAGGDFHIPVEIQTSQAMKRIFFDLAIGPTVQITNTQQ